MNTATKEYKRLVCDNTGLMQVETTTFIYSILRFKRKKTQNHDWFKERYVPVLDYWAKRISNKLGLQIAQLSIELFPQDCDNVIKDLVTLRLVMEVKKDA